MDQTRIRSENGSSSTVLPPIGSSSREATPATLSPMSSSNNVPQPAAPSGAPKTVPLRRPVRTKPMPVSSVDATRYQQAEKDTDDPSTSLEHRKSMQNTSTTTALAGLFTASQGSPVTSRNPSFVRSAPYMRSVAYETASLPNHLYARGLLGGRHSDITVIVFGVRYALHRLVLDRAPFFESALSEPWFEATSKDITLHPEDIDANITKTTFELALKRLYGCADASEEEPEAMGLFATGCWLEMQDLIDASVDLLLRKMRPRLLSSIIELVTTNYYGKPGERILASAKAMLSRDGYEMPIEHWDDIPGDVIKDIVGGDAFYVPDEWDRFDLATRLLDRKLSYVAEEVGVHDFSSIPPWLKAQAVRPHPAYLRLFERPETSQYISIYKQASIQPLLALLDKDIHYIHMGFEQLQRARTTVDALGFPLLPDELITCALWAETELRQKVINAKTKDLALHLSRVTASKSTQGLQNEEAATHITNAINETENATNNAPTLASDDAHLSSNATPRQYLIPNIDCNMVFGGNEEGSNMASAVQNSGRGDGLSTAFQTDEVQWASEEMPSRLTNLTQSKTEKGSTMYSLYAPFRFSVEFPNPRQLPENRRVYSRTIFYAGSLWNVYVLKVRSANKKPQLGVYLHRVKEGEMEEGYPGNLSTLITQTTVIRRMRALEYTLQQRNAAKGNSHTREQSSQNSRSRNQVAETEADAVSSSGSDSAASFDQPTSQTNPPRPSRSGLSSFMTGQRPTHTSASLNNSQRRTDTTLASDAESFYDIAASEDDTTAHDILVEPRTHKPALPLYIDRRPTIKTYFKIYSPSKGGRMLSVYESAPDKFNLSQSWGWKSNTLMIDERMDGGVDIAQPRSPGEDASGSLNSTEAGIGIEVDNDGRERERMTTRSKSGKLRFMIVLGVV